MNPRRRRNIARAILAGIPADQLNTETIRSFLENENNGLELTEHEKKTVLVNSPKSTNTETVLTNSATNEVDNLLTEPNTKVATKETKTAGLKATFSLKNSKAELITAAEKLNLKFKKSFSKAKLLELINNAS